MHLPLRPIFRQLPPNFIDVRTAYASEIWAQLTKKSSRKIKYKKIPRVHMSPKGEKYMVIRGRAPLRVSFGGGGTDVAPFCEQQGGAIIGSTN